MAARAWNDLDVCLVFVVSVQSRLQLLLFCKKRGNKKAAVEQEVRILEQQKSLTFGLEKLLWL